MNFGVDHTARAYKYGQSTHATRIRGPETAQLQAEKCNARAQGGPDPDGHILVFRYTSMVRWTTRSRFHARLNFSSHCGKGRDETGLCVCLHAILMHVPQNAVMRTERTLIPTLTLQCNLRMF